MLAKETYEVVTTLFGLCTQKKNPHIFCVGADLVSFDLRKKLNGNAKSGKFAIKYKFTAAMKQMGNGISQIETLCGFLDLPTVIIQPSVSH